MAEDHELPDDDEAYRLEPETSERQRAREDSMRRRLQDQLDDRTKFKAVELVEQQQPYSIRDVLLLTGLASVLFGVSRFVTPDIFAGALGLSAFIGLILLSVFKPQRSIFHVGWWILLSLYVLTAVVAIVRDR
ncbi:MAG: hypothetical protein VB835_13085 [Pirellulales bacterium]